jgi:hypothetical protein
MGVLLMVMTIGGLLIAGILLGVSVARQITWLRNFVLGGVGVWLFFYFALLFGFSAASEERNLGLNEPKEHCGFYLDCHMHTAVSRVRRTKTIGNKTADGEFYIVKVKVFSDAIAATLGLEAVDAHVVDDRGRTYCRDIMAESNLPRQPDFEKRISPVESLEKEIVFDLPAHVENPRLDIREGHRIERLIEAVLIGDEDSFLHRRAYFTLTEPAETAGMEAK